MACSSLFPYFGLLLCWTIFKLQQAELHNNCCILQQRVVITVVERRRESSENGTVVERKPAVFVELVYSLLHMRVGIFLWPFRVPTLVFLYFLCSFRIVRGLSTLVTTDHSWV